MNRVVQYQKYSSLCIVFALSSCLTDATATIKNTSTMKLFLPLLTLLTWHSTPVWGAGFSTCDEQSHCMYVRYYKNPTHSCAADGCEILVCLEIDYSKPGCTKLPGSTINHICAQDPLNPNQCQGQYPNFPLGAQLSNVQDKTQYCVSKLSGQPALFILGDGGACRNPTGAFAPDFSPRPFCSATAFSSYDGVPFSPTSASFYYDVESCSTVASQGKECIWGIPTGGIDCNTLPVLGDTRPPNAGGDPHFRTWHGHKYDYHGACDLVLLHSEKFDDGLGIDIHIRTKHRGQYSYITTAALRIGDEIFEVMGQDGGTHILNGEVNMALPAKIAGHKITYNRHSDFQQTYLIHLPQKQTVVIKTWHDIVSVSIEHGTEADFGDAVGLMGDFSTGRLMARDGGA
jgi:hypothetical protein